ncbi:hypothetical protein M514_07003 [Trichuris suis]|uniref:Integrase catalytic domain-containing protein n=1 Tax=Trichuris suis TaxID=68888 RepID=A0A085N6U0_9BILA|nr:hypothetical protein M513_07003 [Trichuris suis]KFD65186.1 hypothetical protein M514_07003 [Trichuris suis]
MSLLFRTPAVLYEAQSLPTKPIRESFARKRDYANYFGSPTWTKQLKCAFEIALDETALQYRGPLNPVPLQSAAWEKLAIDIVGPMPNLRYGEKLAITLIDYYSKWREAKFCQNATTKDVIQFLKEVFSREGQPREIVSDNGVQFTSNEFNHFLRDRTIRHCRTSLYYAKQTVKLEDYLQIVFRMGRPKSEAVTGETPSRLLHGQTVVAALPSILSQKRLYLSFQSKHAKRSPNGREKERLSRSRRRKRTSYSSLSICPLM